MVIEKQLIVLQVKINIQKQSKISKFLLFLFINRLILLMIYMKGGVIC